MAQLQARQPHGRLAVEGRWGRCPQWGQQPALCHSKQHVLTLLGLLILIPAQGLHPLQFPVPQEQGQREGIRVGRCDVVGCAGHLLVQPCHQGHWGDSQLVWEGCEEGYRGVG